MQLFRTLRILLLTGILLCTFTPAFFSQDTLAKAQNTANSITLYFTPYNPLDAEDEFGSIQMSRTPPTTQNDSSWPPQLLIKADGKRIPELNTEEILAWIELWVMYKFSQFDDLYTNDTEGLPDEFDQYFKQLFEMFNPFKIQEDFIYTGEEPAELSGEIIYNLYFASHSKLFGEKDAVNVGIAQKKLLFGELPILEEIKNTSASIKPTLLPSQTTLVSISLNLENNILLVEPNDILSFTVEIIPTQHVLSKVLLLAEKLGLDDGDFLRKIADFLTARKIETFKQWGEALHEIIDTIALFSEEGINLTISDIGEIADALQGSSFLFASSTHPSHILIPLKIAGDTENSKVYYLHDQNTMNEDIGTAQDPLEADFSKNLVSWTSPPLQRSKKIQYASAGLFINARSIIKKTPVTVSLYADKQLLGTTTKILNRDLLFSKPQEPILFTFENIDTEISFGSSLTLQVSISETIKRGSAGKIFVLYNTERYASNLAVSYTETDNIQVHYQVYPENQLIVPGGSLRYILNITSKKNDEITISYKTNKPEPNWKITMVGAQTQTYSAGQYHQMIIYVNSTDPTKKAYKENIDLTFIISGKTGLVKQKTHAEISEEARQINLLIVGYTPEIIRKKGQDAHFYIVLQNNNTAAIDDSDSYTISAESSNNWPVDNTRFIKNLETGKKTDPHEILIVVSIPQNTTQDSDTIHVTIKSDADPTKTAQVFLSLKISGPDLIESISNLFKPIYEFFKTAAQLLGLTDVFGGEFAPIVLVSIVMIMILFFCSILVLVFTKKTVQIICLDRIKEIQPDQSAAYTILLKNLTHKTQSYTVSTNPQSTKLWQISLDRSQITLPANETQELRLMIQPTPAIQPDEWIKVDVYVSPMNHTKKQKISVVAMIHAGSTCLQITDVHHFPSEFTAGEHIQTSCKLVNKGTLTAQNVKVLLYVNGKQKNKIQVTIPSKSYADISLPWIAVKGKNKIRIKVVEQ